MQMPRASVLTGALAVTNVLLLAHILLPRRLVARWLRRLTTSERPQLGRQPSDQQSVPQSTPLGAELGGLLGKDYLPPLPQPVADALDRSCLCFLATAGTGSEMVEPHLSLMRYTVLTRTSVLQHGPRVPAPCLLSTDGSGQLHPARATGSGRGGCTYTVHLPASGVPTYHHVPWHPRRYTYTSGLDPDDDGGRREVMVISTQRKTKKFDILTRNGEGLGLG